MGVGDGQCLLNVDLAEERSEHSREKLYVVLAVAMCLCDCYDRVSN
jgi:hypothetical protein